MSEVYNARIESTQLGYLAHGVLTCLWQLAFRGVGQGFGGWNFGTGPGSMPAQAKALAACLGDLLRVAGVKTWEEVSGRLVRVELEGNKILRVGHILKDIWFHPEMMP
jgi:hypothetical protein